MKLLLILLMNLSIITSIAACSFCCSKRSKEYSPVQTVSTFSVSAEGEIASENGEFIITYVAQSPAHFEVTIKIDNGYLKTIKESERDNIERKWHETVDQAWQMICSSTEPFVEQEQFEIQKKEGHKAFTRSNNKVLSTLRKMLNKTCIEENNVR